MEQEHPIPQQISSYQFRLVGDMTIKQFFQVAAGALVAIILYSSNLPGYVKWPLIVFSFLTGIAFAFFPLQDRPLSKWIFLFIKSIYSPTVYVWKKVQPKPQIFQTEPSQQPPLTPTQEAAPPTTLPQVQQTITPPPSVEGLEKLEKTEQEFLTKVTQQFKTTSPPPMATVLQKAPVSAEDKERKPVQVVKAKPVKVESVEKGIPKTQVQTPSPTTSVGSQVTPFAGRKTRGAQLASFSEEAAPPIPPTKPNIVVGQVLDAEGGIIEAAILEIKDEEGRPSRALRTNKLGHFMIVTPLSTGKYEIITEKEGCVFEPITFEAKGEIIPPIAIQAKNLNRAKS